MTGMNRNTGKRLEGDAHLRQSVADLLTTSLRSRVMRAGYGSELYDCVDAPISAETTARITACVVDALAKWEPRLKVVSCKPVRLTDPAAGKIRISLTLKHTDTARTQTEEIIF